MENITNDYSHIPGWGFDADPTNEPTHPMKNYTGDDHKRSNWERPPLQPVDVEILHSNERPSVSATFGTSSPPSGLSGAIRRFAFRFSESEYGHWLPLLLADRVNMVEGLVEDLAKGHIPNIFAEMGWTAKWKHDRPGLVANVAVGALTAVVVIGLLQQKKVRKGLKRAGLLPGLLRWI